jgi:predicted metal-dependent peptidase
LEQVDAELARLVRRSSVLVVECDAAIQRIYPYRKLGSFRGRGGTDVRPPGARVRATASPDLVIFFTNGHGRAPEIPPRAPVIRCLTADGRPPAPWGRAIRMEPDGRRRVGRPP